LDATIAIMKQTIPTIPGSAIPWPDLVTAVGPVNRRYILAAMSSLEAEGYAARRTRYDPAVGGVFEVVKL